MPTIYSECPKEVSQMATTLMKRWHPDLIAADVQITYLFANNDGDDGEPPLKHHGYPAAAIVSRTSYLNRVAGHKDAIIRIDERRWQDMSEQERAALLDHELLHLEVMRDKNGGIKYDDASRPVLGIREHDFEISGFHSIVDRHGSAAPEAQAVQAVTEHWKQEQFDWKQELEAVA